MNLQHYTKALPRDLSSGVVVFLVALPLCLGIAVASGAPPISGLIAGIIGGLLVSWLSGSHTSVSGPAAGLTAVVIAQVESLGSFEAFLVAVVIAGVLQIILGLLKAGSLAAFFPSSVIKGLLAAIGIILILKQFPHLFGHDPDWMGDLGFNQMDGKNTFTELAATMFDIHTGALIIGLLSVFMLVFWNRTPLEKLGIPAPLAVVVVGIGLSELFRSLASADTADGASLIVIGTSHLVQVPMTSGFKSLFDSLTNPSWAILSNPTVYIAAITIAIVASLETLLNLEAVDNLDRKKRVSPPNRELVAQGVGNMTSGLLGGLPVTSVIVRSSVNVTAGSETRISCFFHGLLLLLMVAFFPGLLNLIPLSCLAAILMVTGFKLASPKTFKTMWSEGANQFLPFIATIIAIIVTDLLIGIGVGIAVSIGFILRSNLSQPIHRIVEKHVGGEIHRIELANQVSFLNRASLAASFHSLKDKSHVVVDASNTDYIDADILDLIKTFEKETGPAHGIKVSLSGFKDRYRIEDRIQYVDVTTRDVQAEASPDKVLNLLREGNERFVKGEPVARNPHRQIGATSDAQFPLAIVLACMDSRIATEMVFDLGIGDIFSVRVAGNVAAEKELGSLEYGCAVAGAKVLLVMGHTRCGAVNATIDLAANKQDPKEATGCEHIGAITQVINQAIDSETTITEDRNSKNEAFSDRVTELNVRLTMKSIPQKSEAIAKLVREGKVIISGAIYDVKTGKVKFLEPNPS